MCRREKMEGKVKEIEEKRHLAAGQLENKRTRREKRCVGT